jgi:D-tyrosyl-tRNA(Tyr) deacylase
MIGLLQRVSRADVSVAGKTVGEIGQGLLVLIGVEKGDGEAQAARLAERLLTYRVFSDVGGKMNRSVQDVQGGLLLVPQFTLAADTRSGARAGFSTAAEPSEGRRLFDVLVAVIKERHTPVATGVFGADMRVSLVNEGPVTFWLRVPPDAVQGRPQ